jgi:uncharacterized membrane protein YagU involved in acid resistance|tara:strand:- start:1338 stop:1586 length:249 start_codon:yes stop_codon:yes gene_type:complete
MRKKIIALLFSTIILFGSCASAKPSWDRVEPPSTLLEAVGVEEKDNPKVKKDIWKTLVFTTVSFMIYSVVEHNNIKYNPNGR